MFPDKIYYEPQILEYELGKKLFDKYNDKEWIEIDNHNNIPHLRQSKNSEFKNLKRLLIIGTRKTHKYSENHKVSDYLVPYTSSGCSAMCLYCYLVCNYNKCSYMRIFVNREQMMKKLIKTADNSLIPQTFEIGSNSDLLLENTITDNLPWTIEQFSKTKHGYLTFPSKFNMVEPLLSLNHQGKVIFRMSVNPQSVINKIEIGTSSLKNRVEALNKMAEAGYKTGILIAPVVITTEYKTQYRDLLEYLSENLSEKIKENGFIEIILMTYSYIHRAINSEAFGESSDLFDSNLMKGRGAGKYCYRDEIRYDAEVFLTQQCKRCLPHMSILYIS